MINKLVSLMLIFTILVNPVYSQVPENVLNADISLSEKADFFKNSTNNMSEELKSLLDYYIIWFPMSDLPDNLPSSDKFNDEFEFGPDGLFCINTDDHTNLITEITSHDFNIKSITSSERKACDDAKKQIITAHSAEKAILLNKIKRIESELTIKKADYDSLVNKTLWIQAGTSVAMLIVSGLIIYSVQK